MGLMGMFTSKLTGDGTVQSPDAPEKTANGGIEQAIMGMAAVSAGAAAMASVAPEMLSGIKSSMSGLVTGGHEAHSAPAQVVGSAPAKGMGGPDFA